MINQSLDISKLGFRWTGVYNSSKTYVNGDVAFKDGYAKAYVNSVWKDFGIDQQDMVRGSVLLKDGNASGLPGQQFMVRNDGTVGFGTPALRNGTLGVSLGGQDEIYSHNRTTRNCWHSLMSDYSVRAVGSNQDGQMGVGPDGVFVRPVTVPFPRDTKIVRVINGYGVTFFITDTGQLWACGKDQYYGGYSLSEHGTNNAETPVNLSNITSLAGEQIASVITNCSDAKGTIYSSTMALTTSGKVFAWGNNANGMLGLGHDNIVPNPELLYWTEFVPIQKAYILNGNFLDGAATFLIDNTGKLYVAGDDDASLFNAADILTHKLLNPWGTSKRVVAVRTNAATYYDTSFMGHWASSRSSITLIVEDALSKREVYGRGSTQMTWNRSITNAPYWKIGETQYMQHGGSQQTVSTNVRDVAFFELEDLQAVLIDSNGHLFHLGKSTYWQAHSSDITSATSKHNIWFQYDTSIATGIIKFYCSFAHNALTMVALRDDGKIIVAGYNGSSSAKLNGNTNDGFVEVPPLPFTDKVIDLFVSGFDVRDASSADGSPASENNRQIILLTETGEIYAGGDNSQGTLGKGTLTSSQTFQKVHF
jgi:alpha-tubulin suppressor-like RCC1 family protein